MAPFIYLSGQRSPFKGATNNVIIYIKSMSAESHSWKASSKKGLNVH